MAVYKLYKTKFLPSSLFSFKIELMENEDILYGYTGKKTDCKTRAWSPFWKCMIELKTFEAIKYFRRLAYVNICCSFVDLIKLYGISKYQNQIFFEDNNLDD